MQVEATVSEMRFQKAEATADGNVLSAIDSTYSTPMPCRILQLIGKDGQKVKTGDGILVMESMKTEIKLLARSNGTLKLLVKEGDT